MPKALENKLRRQATKAIGNGSKSAKKRKRAYVYGTMRKIEEQHEAKGGRPGKYMHL